MKTMMKMIAVMLIAVMLMSSAALAAGQTRTASAARGAGRTIVATRDEANIRKGPSTSCAVVGKTVRGKTATYAGEMVRRHGRIWLKVRFNGKTGWISSEYVKLR